MGPAEGARAAEEAGFTSIEVKQVEGDIFNSYYIASTRMLA